MGLTEYPFISYPILSIQAFSVVITMLRVGSEAAQKFGLGGTVAIETISDCKRP
jgi:hypothetical protein